MKRIVSFAMVALMLLTLGITSFADYYESPSNPQEIKVIVDTPGGGNASFEYDDETGGYKIKADVTDGYQFVKWYIRGEYTILSGSLTDPYIVIKLSDGAEVHAVLETKSGLKATVEEGTTGGSADVSSMGEATFKFSAKTDAGYKFVKWSITGDYTVISGSLTSEEIVVKATTDLHGVAYWNGESKDGKSPKTGYEIAVLAGIALVALCGAAYSLTKFEKE